MKFKILFLSFISIMCCSVQQANAQSSHLIEIGTLDSLYSQILNESREIYVQLPENFDPESDQKYPVAYVLDGDDHLNAVTTVHSYYWGGFIPEMIIVGISNRKHRNRDLTTSTIQNSQGFQNNQENGSAEIFTEFIESELIPYIENNYPVTNYRTLIGHSYGGLFTVNTLMKHPDLFENYLAIDPSLDWDNQKLLKKCSHIFSREDFTGKSIFISLGGQLHMQNKEINIDNVMADTSEYTLFARSNIEFSTIAKENELNVLWKFYANDLHGSIPLPSILDGLIFLFDWYPIENTDLFNSPDTPKNELFQVIRKREEKLKSHYGYFVPPFEEELLNMLGYMNLEWDQTEKSLAFFKLTTEYFPSSANAYDSLADYYVSQDDYKNALINVSKAYELSGSEYHNERINKFREKINQ
jgi:predicted alpha/beta superfamily hydrolase